MVCLYFLHPSAGSICPSYGLRLLFFFSFLSSPHVSTSVLLRMHGPLPSDSFIFSFPFFSSNPLLQGAAPIFVFCAFAFSLSPLPSPLSVRTINLTPYIRIVIHLL